jgi:hypothetical protein
MPGFQESLSALRQQAEIDIALGKLRSSEEATQTIGFAELQERLPNQRYNPEVLDALAAHALKVGQNDLAQGWLADIVAMPMLEAIWVQSRAGQPPGDPTPRERLLKLWEEKHGNVDGFEQMLTEVYNQGVTQILEQARSKSVDPVSPDAGNHTVLVELFTGTVCPPCVAADLAATALRQTYPTSKVVVLQFHQHLPGPDPLTNQDGEDRFAYYAAEGTPAVLIDGGMLPPPGAGGILQHVSQAYAMMRPSVDQRLKVTTPIVITATAAVENGELSVQAAVEGMPEDRLPTSRLRLALAEDKIEMQAPNGLREHELVVREMLGGAKGTGAKSGKLGYSLQMPLAELKQHLVDYLSQFEAGRTVSFPDKPLTLKPLSLVVWVQDDQTHEILQTTIVPVTGELNYPGDEPAQAPDAPTSAKTPENATKE